MSRPASIPSLTANRSTHSVVYPLDEFYGQAARPLPRIETIQAADLPEPSRSLLVHDSDMTSTLEKFHAHPLHLELLRMQRAGKLYFREVILVLNATGLPVEFGAITIHLERFDPASRKLILEGIIPLGRILNESGVGYTSHPEAFLKIQADDFISRALKIPGQPELFGRRNTLRNYRGEPLAEIVEILPPSRAIAGGNGNPGDDR